VDPIEAEPVDHVEVVVDEVVDALDLGRSSEAPKPGWSGASTSKWRASRPWKGSHAPAPPPAWRNRSGGPDPPRRSAIEPPSTCSLSPAPSMGVVVVSLTFVLLPSG
jgi:hypothetical protein